MKVPADWRLTPEWAPYTEWGALMTGSAIATLALVVLFVLTSRPLISGLTAGAVE